MRTVLDRLLQERLQRVPRSVVLLEVGGPQPDGLPLREDGQRMSENGSSAVVSTLPNARLSIFHPVEENVQIEKKPGLLFKYFKSNIIGFQI